MGSAAGAWNTGIVLCAGASCLTSGLPGRLVAMIGGGFFVLPYAMGYELAVPGSGGGHVCAEEQAGAGRLVPCSHFRPRSGGLVERPDLGGYPVHSGRLRHGFDGRKASGHISCLTTNTSVRDMRIVYAGHTRP